MMAVPEVPLPNTRTKIFALDGMPEISTFFTFLKTRRHGVEMENGIEPKKTISLTWDDPWKKYEEIMTTMNNPQTRQTHDNKKQQTLNTNRLVRCD